jgi:hypothetical protein
MSRIYFMKIKVKGSKHFSDKSEIKSLEIIVKLNYYLISPNNKICLLFEQFVRIS